MLIAVTGDDGARVRGARRFLLLGAVLYPAWAYIALWIVGDRAFDPPWQRFVVGALFAAAFGATFIDRTAAQNASRLFTACGFILTLHYLYLLHRNAGETVYAFGCFVVVVGVSAGVETWPQLAAYAGFVIVGAAVTTALHPNLWSAILLPGVATMLGLTAVSLQNRLRMEQARVDLLRAESDKEHATAAVRVRDDFLSIAGHELKTPLTAVLLQLQSLQRQLRAGQVDLEQLPGRLEKTANNLGRLTVLVDQLLDVSRITAGRLAFQFEPVELRSLVAEVAERFEDQLARAGSTLSVSGPPSTEPLIGQWDRSRIDQVLTNLIGNAIKYGQGRPIEVTLASTLERAIVSVRDRGIGIPSEHQSRIFGRFERAVSDRNYGGLGLGLWITREIVEAHRGRIGFVSGAGEGTIFTVELPRVAPTTGHSSSQAEPGSISG